MEKVDYDARLHAVYAAGRQMSPDALHNLDGGVRSPPAARHGHWSGSTWARVPAA